MEMSAGTELVFTCPDSRALHGTVFDVPRGVERRGTVVIASATAVKATYYHRYAAFLAANGFTAITFDYRGIGESRGGSLRGQRIRWYQWGCQDIDTVLAWAMERSDDLPVNFVGHSFGGFGVGLAEHAAGLSRILTVGAQHAYWGDLTLRRKAGHWGRAAVMLPLVAVMGYFPAKRLRLMEDLPAGVALDWARSRKDFPTAASGSVRDSLRAHQAAVRAPILALAPNDDEYATLPAMNRALSYTPNSPSRAIHLLPADYGESALGHFALFHGRYQDTFWEQTLDWLRGRIWPPVPNPAPPHRSVR